VVGFEQTRPAEDDNIFQVLPAAVPVETALGQHVKTLGYKKPVAAVSNNTAVYQNFYAGFQNGFGLDVPKFEMGSDAQQIRSQALAIVNSKPDVVAFFMAPQDGALLLKEILRITSPVNRPYFVFDQSVQSGGSDYKTILGSDISKINGSLVAMSRNDFTADFSAKFQAKYNELPVFGSDMGYNAFLLLAETYDSNSARWISNMKTVKFIGADGELSFDASGLRVPNTVFEKLENGRIILK
jgi:ABC-type branched-subunit amino acid transport system substrate-binding protein